MEVSKEEQRGVAFSDSGRSRGNGHPSKNFTIVRWTLHVPCKGQGVAQALQGRTGVVSQWCTVVNTTPHYWWHRPAGLLTHYPGLPSYSESRSCRGLIERRKCTHHHDGKSELAQSVCPTVFNHNRKHVKWPTLLIICSAMPGKGMSSWHEWWMEMSLGVEPESKWQSLQCKHPGSPPPKKIQCHPRKCRKSYADVLLWPRRPLLIDFLQCETTVNAQWYSQTLTTLHQAIKSKWPGKLTHGVILFHDNTRPHTANTITALLQKFKWEVLGHPPHSSDLSPHDYAIFGPRKKTLRGKRFTSDDDVKQYVQNWFTTKSREF